MANPSTTPTSPPAKEIRTASMMNWRMMSQRRAPTARRTPISRVRSRMAASMMFMMPMPPTRREMEAMATMPVLKSCSVRFCWARSSAGTVALKSQALRGEMQIETNDLILQTTLRVFEPVEDRIQWREDEVVHVFGADAGNLGLRGKLWRNDSDYMAPLLVEFDVFADRGGSAKQTVFCRSAEDAHGRCGSVLRGLEEAALRDAEMADQQVTGLDAVNDR